MANKINLWLDTRQGTSLSIEIGCGVGLHPIKWAQSHTENSLLALERTQTKFLKFEGRTKNHSLPNLFGAHAEASVLLPFLFAENCIDQFFIFYPNPYPKKDQSNLRWANSPFLDWVANALKPSGTIEFRTNLESYKDELIQLIPMRFAFLKVSHKILDPGLEPETHFEKKYQSRRNACHQIILTKT